MAYKWLSLGQNHQEYQSFALWPKYIKLVLSADQSSLVAVVPQTAFLVLLTGFYKATCAKTLAKNHRKLRCNSCSTLHRNKWGQVKPTKFKRQFQSLITTWMCPRCVTKSLLAELPMAGIGNTSCESLFLDEGEEKVRMYGEDFDSGQLSELAASELPDCEGIVVDCLALTASQLIIWVREVVFFFLSIRANCVRFVRYDRNQ